MARVVRLHGAAFGMTARMSSLFELKFLNASNSVVQYYICSINKNIASTFSRNRFLRNYMLLTT